VGLRKWDDLPENAKKYILFIEKAVGVKIRYVGTGPGQENMIVRD
jgi:adenylosuccinate synthase